LDIGAVDLNGNRIDYTDALTTLQKADDFNDTHKGLVASVIQHGDIYNLAIWEKNADTFNQVSFIKSRL